MNGATITSSTLGRIGNGPFRVILGQRESDDESPGNPAGPPTGPNEAAWYNASLTTNYCSTSSFSPTSSLDYSNGGIYQGYLQDCWLAEQSPYTSLSSTMAAVESAIGATDVATESGVRNRTRLSCSRPCRWRHDTGQPVHGHPVERAPTLLRSSFRPASRGPQSDGQRFRGVSRQRERDKGTVSSKET